MAADNVVVHVSNDNWQNEVMDSKVPVLVDFWAEWCGPCRMMAPILDELAGELDEKLKIAKVDIDGNQELAQRFHVQSIPTLLVFKGGVVQGQMVGAMSKSDLRAKLDSYL